MDDLYKKLGFKQPESVENPYGIKIYLGTKGKPDWCVEIPKELIQIKCPWYKPNANQVIYMISEDDALRIAEKYTTLARRKNNE